MLFYNRFLFTIVFLLPKLLCVLKFDYPIIYTLHLLSRQTNLMSTSDKKNQLLDSLTKFIALISSSNAHYNVTHYNLASNYLRVNLLSVLRECYGQKINTFHRDDLVQWWMILLNYLNSNSLHDISEKSYPAFVDTASVSLECISRLIALTIVDKNTKQRDLNIYSHHIYMTIQYITNTLVNLVKYRNKLMEQAPNQVPIQSKRMLTFIQSYTSLLHSLIGKVIAFGYFFLKDYDFMVLRFFDQQIIRFQVNNKILPWKLFDFQYTSTSNKTSEETHLQEHTKLFKIMISYLQNDQIFMTFYWHCWYIMIKLHLISTHSSQKINLKCFTGYNIISKQVSLFLEKDLNKLSYFMKKRFDNNLINGNIQVQEKLNFPPNYNTLLNNEVTNNYIYSNFRSIKLWECLRDLVGCFHNSGSDTVQLLHDIIVQHEKLQLTYILKIPAYDAITANIIYNKLFQFMIFQFKSIPDYLSDFQWHDWVQGIVCMISTLNFQSQAVAFICLFNTWEHIPETERKVIFDYIIDKCWNTLTIDNNCQIILILFMKLLVFRMIKDISLEQIKIYEKIRLFYNEILQLNEIISYDKDIIDQDPLIFQSNKKLTIVKVDPSFEGDLINGEHSISENNEEPLKKLPFPHVRILSNIRPSVVLLKTIYPYDVFDEMLSRKLSLSKKENQKLNLNQKSNSDLSFDDEPRIDKSNVGTFDCNRQSIFNSIGSFFSKFSNLPKFQQQTKLDEPLKQYVNESWNQISLNDINIYTELDQVDTLSLCSNTSTDSSIYTKASLSSEDLLFHRFTGVQNSLTKSKKIKLVSPPELKFSDDVTTGLSIEFIFRPVSISTMNLHGSKLSILDKIRKANDKWDVLDKNCSKPLPRSPLDTQNETLLNDFDFESLSPTTEDLETPIRNFKVDETFQFHIDEIPEPKWDLFTIYTSLSYQTSDKSPLKSSKVTKNYEQDHEMSPASMLKKTRLTKLMKLIKIFNATIEEYHHYQNIASESKNLQLFMEYEISGQFHTYLKNNINEIMGYK